jgi:PmbA protein
MQTPVIFTADLARGLLNNFLSAASGRSIYMESSFLLNKLNQSSFPGD